MLTKAQRHVPIPKFCDKARCTEKPLLRQVLHKVGLKAGYGKSSAPQGLTAISQVADTIIKDANAEKRLPRRDRHAAYPNAEMATVC